MNTKGTASLFIIIGILLILVILGTFYFLKQNNSINSQFGEKPTPQSTPFSKTEQPTIEDVLSIKTPPGWKKSTYGASDEKDMRMTLESLNFAPGAAGGPDTNAIGMAFRLESSGNSNALEEKYIKTKQEIEDPNPGGEPVHTLTRTTVAGYPAISFFLDFEGHTHTYLLQVGDQLWSIRIYSSSEIQEKEYKEDIDMILSSLKFKS